MIAIQSLSLIEPRNAAVGTLLLQRAGYPGVPVIVSLLPGDDEDEAKPVYLALQPKGQRAFEIRHAVTNEGSWLAINRWELRVDPRSSFNANDEGPRHGDAFIWNDVPGIVGMLGYGSTYVPLRGEIFMERTWAGFVGFRSWSIMYWPDPEGDPVELLAHSRDASP